MERFAEILKAPGRHIKREEALEAVAYGLLLGTSVLHRYPLIMILQISLVLSAVNNSIEQFEKEEDYSRQDSSSGKV